jgi:ABC-type glycerol-3-phosphate transport system substrate-binding protein
VLGLYYNADLYKSSGLDPDKPPATWDELLSNARAIAKPDRAIWGHYFPTKPVSITADRFWLSYLWQAGGEWLSPDESEVAFNSAAGVEALQFYVDMVHKFKVTPMKGIDNLSMGTEFETGNIGHMTLYAIWVVRAKVMKFPVRTARLPRYKKEATGTGMGVAPVFKDAKRKEEAWMFLDWLTKPANAIEWVRGLGNLPTRLSLREEPAWKQVVKDNPLIEPFVEGLPTARLEYLGPGALEIAKVVAVGIEAATFGQKSAKQALDDAAKEANEILKRERAKARG